MCSCVCACVCVSACMCVHVCVCTHMFIHVDACTINLKDLGLVVVGVFLFFVFFSILSNCWFWFSFYMLLYVFFVIVFDIVLLFVFLFSGLSDPFVVLTHHNYNMHAGINKNPARNDKYKTAVQKETLNPFV